MLIPFAPCNLLAPIVTTIEGVKICESGVYNDKFGQIHRHQFFQWCQNLKKDYIPILLEHQPFTYMFFGYIYGLQVDKEDLLANMALTKYGVLTLQEYQLRHMGCGWSVGVPLPPDKDKLLEVSLCCRPRVSSTHVITLDNHINFDNIKMEKSGMRNHLGEEDPVGEDIYKVVLEIVKHEIVADELDMINRSLAKAGEDTYQIKMKIAEHEAQGDELKLKLRSLIFYDSDDAIKSGKI